MKYLLFAYLAFFTIFAIGLGIVLARNIARNRHELLESFFDFVAALVLWLGMVMLAMGVEQAVLQTAWLLFSVVSAIYVVISSYRDRRAELNDEDSTMSAPVVAITDILVIILLLPAVAYNLQFSLASDV